MEIYQEARVKLSNTQLNKLKSAVKNKVGTILRLANKKFEDEELPFEFLLTTRQTTKIKNIFANNTSTYIRLSKYQISKITQSRGSFGSWLGNLGKKALTNIAIILARENLSGLISNLISNAINKFERKIGGNGAARAEKEFASFILNKDMNEIKQLGRFLGAIAASFVKPVISSVVKGVSG